LALALYSLPFAKGWRRMLSKLPTVTAKTYETVVTNHIYILTWPNE